MMPRQPRNWRELHKRSLRENQPKMFKELSQTGQLNRHLEEVDQEASEMYSLLVKRMLSRNPSRTLDQVSRSATEVVMQDLVLVKDAETQEADRLGGYVD